MPIAIDTETTGLDPRKDRLVEIGAVCLETGAEYHVYCNPGTPVPSEAAEVHGLTDDFLAQHPPFTAAPLLAFLGDSTLVAHNAGFDVAFLNAELARAGLPPLVNPIEDSLALARRRHPNANCTLDALCRRYGIDTAAREKHGALLDAELLAAVYPELLGRQATLDLAVSEEDDAKAPEYLQRDLPPRITAAEIDRHAKMLENIPGNCWSRFTAP